VPASPACLLRIAAPPGLVKTIVAGSEFEVREVRPGELLATMGCAGITAEQALAEKAERIFELVRSTFDGGSAFRLLGFRVSGRPMPAQGPMVGFLTPDQAVYVAVMHSAVSLAPVVGRVVADELLSGEPDDVLRGCRPVRVS
jgi:glycine/D-amino acid oxidase-like deaminating enzyme